MGRKRPYKVRYHFDGTKQFSDDETLTGAYIIDTSRPIDAMSSHADLGAADDVARRVSRNGGNARITLRDIATGVEAPIKSYAAYEVAIEDLAREEGVA